MFDKKDDVKSFLEKFDISKNEIEDFFNEKKIIEKEKNIFLIDNSLNFEKSDMQKGLLLFINLKKILPSKFLLRFIKSNSSNIIELLNEKQALNFTYGKNIQIESITKPKEKYNKGKNYIVVFEDKILGYSSFQKEGKKFNFKNEMNIGDYLKEN